MTAENTQHLEEALDQLLEQFKGRPRLEAMIASYMTQIQDLETAFHDLLTERFISTAIGAQLDGIGQIVVLPRNGLTDEEYRTALRGKIRVNLSNGTPPELITIVRLMVNDPALLIRLVEVEETTVEIEVLEGTLFPTNPELIGAFLILAKAAGVRIIFRYSYAANFDNQFVFSDADDFPTFDTDTGFDDATSPGTGDGELNGAIGS
jgi:hypothetical protein